MDNHKQSLSSVLVGNALINKEIFRLDFIWQGPAPKPGQFFLIKPRRSAVFLARPISVALWQPTASNTICFLIAKRGPGTEELLTMRLNEEAEISGPLGNCWEEFFPHDTNKSIALLGGGIGIAPLQALPEAFPKYTFDFYAGFRTRFKTLEERYGLLGAVSHSQNLTLATEDGSEGKKGRIPDFLDPAGYAAVYACGPVPMLRAVAVKCEAAGVPCFVSMEKHMACGVGACLGCTVKTIHGNRRCCADGPIFPARELIFDD
jgi:NAD(P)H-flavin reductase